MRKLTAFGICLFICGLLWMFFNEGAMPMIAPYIIPNKYITLDLIVWRSLPFIVMIISILCLLTSAKNTNVESD